MSRASHAMCQAKKACKSLFKRLQTDGARLTHWSLQQVRIPSPQSCQLTWRDTFAGIVENYPALEYPTSRMKKLYDVNVHGAFFCAREVARQMIKKKTQGSIVLVSSMSANVREKEAES